MTIDTNNLIESILASISRIDHVKLNDIPNIPLYMDQVTTFMDDRLSVSKRYPEDKILTKTMINNYAKNNLLPPPTKKKYNREHVLVLIFVYYFKNILSIKDIEKLLHPITENYFSTDQDFDLAAIYEEVYCMEKDCIEVLKDDVRRAYSNSQHTFSDTGDDNQDFLQLFSFICALSFDVYLKKQIIEELIDQLPSPLDCKKKKNAEEKGATGK